ncbi:MAG: UvrD-helicase domain-containing protein [Clostridiales bacterium]|nr:UvrD-helicase domain-containing protein [Clostridiales bacterium]MDY5513307.1 UvrD-helicase domain-containing protein [Candidatus Ventricola sp.]
MPEWTREQRDAISDRGHSLIVCAAAGSGKTAVLVERIVSLVREGCPVEQMLVVTFTNAAAGEMRLRIGEALSRAALEDPAMGEQAMALSRASISTLHRFCGNLLRENFQALGLDPAFRIADEQECGVLSAQAMEDALYSCYEVGSEAFLAADACYTQEELADLAKSLRRFMMTRPDPWGWLDEAVAACGADAQTLGESPAVQLLLADARTALDGLYADAEETLAICRCPDGPAHYAGACAQDAALIVDLLDAAKRGYMPLRAALTEASYAALGRKKKGDVFDEALAETVKARRDALKKAVRELAGSFAPTLEEAAEDLRLTRAPLEGLAELVRTYDALYGAAKRRRGVLDFDDLEHGALEALAHPEVREALRARYRYVFVDEYQDSSAIQEAILGSFAREDGQFLVGDVKQSIYRFRQAEPQLFLRKAALYDSEEAAYARRIDLQRNFRSRANVLAGVNAVFSRIMRREATEIEYDAREALIPGLPARADDPPLELHLIYKAAEAQDGAEGADDAAEEAVPGDGGPGDGLPGDGGPGDGLLDERELAAVEREAQIAAERIHALVGTMFYDAKQGRERPLSYRDMAVLMRVARGSAPLAADVLAGAGIPVFCDAGEGYFDMPEIRAMMALLTAIDNGAKDEALLAALKGPALGLEDSELASIRIHTPDTRVPFHEAVRRYREEMDDALSERLRGFEARLARWRLCARHQGVDRLIERIYAETGFPAQAGALPGGAARQANLHLLTSRARAFMRAQGGSLHAFLAYAGRLRAGGDSMSASAIGESEDVVRIMTTHKSKGLEFPVVLVLGLGRRLGGQSLRAHLLLHAQLGVGLPCVDTALMSERDTLLRRAIRVQTAREQLAEEVRILYVAMTRARERLILIGDVGRAQPPDAFFAGGDTGSLLSMRTGLEMIAPTLAAAGASLTIAQEEILAGDSRWQVFAHRAGASGVALRRTDEGVSRLLAALEAEPLEDEALAALMAFDPGQGAQAVRKTSVSAVLRDEKRAAQEAAARASGEDTPPLPGERTEIVRLPRFMQEQRMTGAQIGTAFHRMMRMLDLCALRASGDLEGELTRQAEAMRADGVVTAQEAAAVPVRMLTALMASPLGVRMLRAERLEREWAFTFRRTDDSGAPQLIQGVIDCCFVEDGQWVLADYKTDSPADVAGAIARHRPQLALYAQALHAITGMPVKERLLVLVRSGMSYAV